MERPNRTRNWQREVRVALISILIGTLISGLFGIGRSSAGSMLGFLVTGGLVGFSIYACNSLLALALEPLLSRLGKRSRLLGDVVVYVVGGISGWLAGFVLAGLFLRSKFSLMNVVRGPLLMFILITAVLSVTIGLLFRTFEKLTERLRIREWAERELEIARSLQTRLLPPPTLELPGVSVAARNLAAHTVAGDLYDVVRLDDGSLFLAVADVAGKGMGASLIMASVKSALPYVARDGVVGAVDALNRKLCGELGRREFVALVCARYTPATGLLEIANAGCPDAYLIRGGRVDAVHNPGPRLPLGIRPDLAYESVSVTLDAGDRLLMLTDGMPEAPVNGDPLGYDAFVSIVERTAPSGSAAVWLDALLAGVQASVDEGLADDWTAVVLERTA